MILLTTVALIVVIALLFYLYHTWNFNYWKKRGVAGPEPKLFIGTFPSLSKGDRNIIYEFEDLYKQYKNKQKYIGIFIGRGPQLLLLSPDLVHDVYVTKFKNFSDNHSGHINNDKMDKVYALNPFFLKGQKWKSKRAEITPALTMNRIKASYPVMEKVGLKITDFIKEKIHIHGKDYNFDGKDLCQRYTVQTVCDCVYGIDAGVFNPNESSEILQVSQNLVKDFFNGFGKLEALEIIPLLASLCTIEFMSKEVKIFFTKLMNDAISLRKKTQIDRVDFLNYVMQLKEKKGLSEDEMLSLFISFFGDGFETSANTLANTLLCLARNPEIQTKLRSEIEVNSEADGTILFDKLHDLPFLNSCIYESLRMFTIFSYLSKCCTEETTFTNYDGSTLTITEGTVVNIPKFCFVKDEDYFPQPETYDPNRFSVENGGEKKYRDMGLFIPFGDGPRMCLGQKFGITQVKSGLCEIIRNFEVTVSDKTRKDNLIEPDSIVSLLQGGIWLHFKELKN